MGINIDVVGEYRNKGKSASKRSVELINAVQDIVDQHVNQLTGFFTYNSTSKGEVSFIFHPCEEFVNVEVFGDFLRITAKTSTVGPGYHAYIVDIIEQLSDMLSIEMYWKGCRLGDEGVAAGDESGYAITKDFSALQYEMSQWLKALASQLLEYASSNKVSQLRIALPVDVPAPVENYFSITPLGPRDKEYFLNICYAPSNDLLKLSQDYFIWWEKEWNEIASLKTAISHMWTDIPWHEAEEKDQELYENVLDMLMYSYELNPALEYPWDEWRELAELADSQKDLSFLNRIGKGDPLNAKIGYYRNDIILPVADDWRINIPGRPYVEIDEENTWIISYDDGRMIRLTPQRYKTREMTAKEFLEDIKELFSFSATDKTYEFVNETEASIVSWSDEDEGGEIFWILQGILTGLQGKVILISIIVDDEEDQKWALDVWQSIKYLGE